MVLEYSHSASIPFAAADVWRVAGAFGSLHHIQSATLSTSLLEGGSVRLLATKSGAMLWERLLTYSHASRALSYEIFDTKGLERCPYGVGYIGKLAVEPDCAESARFRYEAIFEVAEGFTSEQAKDAVRQFVEDCAQGISRYLAHHDHANTSR